MSLRERNSFPVVGIDIDGVLADTDRGWANYYGYKRCGIDHSHRPDNHQWDCWKELCQGCWNDVLHDPEIVFSLPVMEGAQYTVGRLSQQYRLIAVTSRGSDVGAATIEWFRAMGFDKKFETVIHYDDKPAILTHYKAMAHIDDAPRKLEELVETSVTPIAFNQPYNQGFSGMRINNWSQALGVLETVRNWTYLRKNPTPI